MKAFSYERAKTPAEAAAAIVRQPNAKFIAGGTNLLDLMKLEIEAPTHLVDCLLYTSPSPRDLSTSRMPSSA